MQAGSPRHRGPSAAPVRGLSGLFLRWVDCVIDARHLLENAVHLAAVPKLVVVPHVQGALRTLPDDLGRVHDAAEPRRREEKRRLNDGRMGGMKDGRKEGWEEGRKEKGRKEARKEGRKEERKKERKKGDDKRPTRQSCSYSSHH